MFCAARAQQTTHLNWQSFKQTA